MGSERAAAVGGVGGVGGVKIARGARPEFLVNPRHLVHHSPDSLIFLKDHLQSERRTAFPRKPVMARRDVYTELFLRKACGAPKD